MLTIVAVIFGVTVLGGLALGIRHFRGQGLPLPLALAHGAAAAVGGLVTFGGGVVKALANGYAGADLGLFVLAALGGFFLLSFHLRKLRLPSPIVVIHALVALAAFGLLLGAILKA
jgi:hypothetical protein